MIIFLLNNVKNHHIIHTLVKLRFNKTVVYENTAVLSHHFTFYIICNLQPKYLSYEPEIYIKTDAMLQCRQHPSQWGCLS